MFKFIGAVMITILMWSFVVPSFEFKELRESSVAEWTQKESPVTAVDLSGRCVPHVCGSSAAHCHSVHIAIFSMPGVIDLQIENSASFGDLRLPNSPFLEKLRRPPKV